MKAKPRLAGLLLAAGRSERLGEPKQLVKLRGETLVLRAARLLLTQTPNVSVVIGAFAAKIGQQLKGLPIGIVRNNNWQEGMGASIACGMNKIRSDPDGVLIMLCDQWRIEQKDLFRLVRAWKEDPNRITTAAWDNKQGPPVIFPRHLFDELRKLKGPVGAKNLVNQQADVVKIELPNAQFDLDTKTDLSLLN